MLVFSLAQAEQLSNSFKYICRAKHMIIEILSKELRQDQAHPAFLRSLSDNEYR